MKLFTKKDRSSFAYWFAHWCAFNMTALLLHHWKFRYLFHDFEKPWLRLFLSYDKVQKIHRNIHPHHGEFYLKHGWLHWDDLVIDWECSHYTKEASPYKAADDQLMLNELNHLVKLGATSEQIQKYERKALEMIDLLSLNK